MKHLHNNTDNPCFIFTSGKKKIYKLNDIKSINSIDRGLLNEVLLEEALRCPTIQIHFDHKLIAADYDARILTFSVHGGYETLEVQFDLCLGADGSYSNVRRQMMRVTR